MTSPLSDGQVKGLSGELHHRAWRTSSWSRAIHRLELRFIGGPACTSIKLKQRSAVLDAQLQSTSPNCARIAAWRFFGNGLGVSGKLGAPSRSGLTALGFFAAEVHALKGACSTKGAAEHQRLARQGESTGVSRRFSWENAPEHVALVVEMARCTSTGSTVDLWPHLSVNK